MNWRDALRALPPDEGRQIELFYAHLVLGRCKDGQEADFLQELIESLPLEQALRTHLQSENPERLLIYRHLVRGTFSEVLKTAMPRMTARLADDFAPLLEEFLDTCAITSRCLRDVTPAFLEHFKGDARAHPVAARIPSYLFELGELEAVRISVAAEVDHVAVDSVSLDLDSRLLFTESARLLHFQYAVHQLPEDERDRTIPKEQSTRLLAYRDPENEVRYLELSELAALLVTRLLSGSALGPALTEACAAGRKQLDEAILSGTASLLADLAERGALIGAAPAS